MRISQPPDQNQQNGKQCRLPPLSFKISFNILPYFYKLLSALSLSSMLVEFSLQLVYIPPCVEKFFKFMMFTVLENALNLGIFTHISSHSKLAPKFLLSTLGRRKLFIPPDSIFSKICFPQHQKEAEETMICFIKIQSENRMTWDIRLLIVCMICNFSNVMVLQFCK